MQRGIAGWLLCTGCEELSLGRASAQQARRGGEAGWAGSAAAVVEVEAEAEALPINLYTTILVSRSRQIFIPLSSSSGSSGVG
jgi:hypothetical protein